MEKEALNQNQIWMELFQWVNTNTEMSKSVREELLARLSKIRLKMQIMFAEIQRRTINNVAIDIELETAIKESILESFQFMSVKEQATVLNTLAKTNELKLARLERQLAGFDLFSNIEFALQTEDGVRAPTVLIDKVKTMTPVKRRNLMNIIDEIKSEITKTNLEATNDTEEEI